MLVIISDLHLTDGSLGASLPPGAFHIFSDRLRELVIGASWRVDGTYRPIERVDVIILGDLLDVIRSGRWLQSDVRPWSNPNSVEMAGLVSRITSDILRENGESLNVLRSLAAEGSLTVPPANRMGQPVPNVPGQPVELRTHYMVGNHDWFFHLPGSRYDMLRNTIAQQIGLAHDRESPFAHEPAENPELLDVLRRHKVMARHGDLYDPFNFEGDRDASSLGDAIVIELLNKFAHEVETKLGSDLPISTLAGLREIDNIRPSLLAPVWIDGLLQRSSAFPAVRREVKIVWDRLADRFLDLDFVRHRDSWSPVDLVDGLSRVLKFSKHVSIGWASSIVTWLHGLRGAEDGSYYRHALAEQDFRNRRAKYIVYGHTHQAESVPLDASYAENYVLNQVYFNSGTWRRVHRPTLLAPAEHEFIPDDCMTYLAFYQGDERRGRPYETWSGTLGVHASMQTVHRIDVEKPARRVADEPARVQARAPHFDRPRSISGIVPVRRS